MKDQSVYGSHQCTAKADSTGLRCRLRSAKGRKCWHHTLSDLNLRVKSPEWCSRANKSHSFGYHDEESPAAELANGLMSPISISALAAAERFARSARSVACPDLRGRVERR